MMRYPTTKTIGAMRPTRSSSPLRSPFEVRADFPTNTPAPVMAAHATPSVEVTTEGSRLTCSACAAMNGNRCGPASAACQADRQEQEQELRAADTAPPFACFVRQPPARQSDVHRDGDQEAEDGDREDQQARSTTCASRGRCRRTPGWKLQGRTCRPLPRRRRRTTSTTSASAAAPRSPRAGGVRPMPSIARALANRIVTRGSSR